MDLTGELLYGLGIGWIATSNSSVSKWKTVTRGIPQGCTLGSILVNIFSDDIVGSRHP